MTKNIQMLGQKFGRLTVLEQVEHTNGRHRRWLCKCSCGATLVSQTNNLRGGHTTSCGCAQRDRVAVTSRKHGMSGHRVYDIWASMRARCHNPANISYTRYGAKGVAVCSRWESFDNFLADMGVPPSPKHSLDRLDNSKGYSKENCRWATPVEQANNKRNNYRFTVEGRTQTVAEWARETGIGRGTLEYRLSRGYSPSVVISKDFKTLRKADKGWGNNG